MFGCRRSVLLFSALCLAPHGTHTEVLQPLQDAPSPVPFACDAGAVDVTVDRKPALEFVSVAPPADVGYVPREFSFAGGPHREVRIYLTATLPELPVGMASEATLSVYVGTAASRDAFLGGGGQWWQLVRRPLAERSLDGRTSQALVFDAKTVGPCFSGSSEGESKCQFADIGLATDDRSLPLITIGFTQDLGGANAANWTDASLLLDLRGPAPRIAATVDCDYNEGGGACTAIDSGEMERSDLTCQWLPDRSDFLCAQETDGFRAHKDFFLFSETPAPSRPGELPSLEAALRAPASPDPVVVTGLGPVRTIQSLESADGSSARLVHAAGTFHVVPGAEGSSGRRQAEPRPLMPVAAVEVTHDPDDGGWTADEGPHFSARAIHRRGGLTVFEVVERWSADAAVPPSDLYFIGVESLAGEWHLDVLRLAGGWEDESCGDVRVPPTAASIGRVRSPFSVDLTIRPPVLENMVSDDAQLRWADETEVNCLRRATVRWKEHRFHVSVSADMCRNSSTPPHISLSPDGRLVVKR